MVNKIIYPLQVISLLLLIHSSVFAQKTTDTDVFTFDFSELKFDTSIDDLIEKNKSGKFFRIQIKNLDQTKWKAEVVINDSIIPSSIDPAKIFGGISPTSIAGLASKLLPLGDMLAPEIIASPIDYAAEDYQDTICLDIKISEEYVPAVDHGIFQLIGLAYDTLIHNYQVIVKAKNEIDSLSKEIGLAFLKSKAIDEDEVDSNFPLNVNRAKNTFQMMRKKITASHYSMNEFLSMYSVVYFELLQKIDSIKLLEKVVKYSEFINSKYKETNTVYENLINSLSDSVFLDLASTIISINNRTDTLWESPVYQFRNDIAKINIKISPLDQIVSDRTYETNIHIPVHKDKAKFGLGTGLFVMTSGNEAYSVQTDSDSTFALVEEDRDGLSYGLSALLKISKPICDKIGYHFDFGPGVTFKDRIRPFIMMGGGLSFGENQAIHLDLGFIVGSRDKLSNAFDTNVDYRRKPESFLVGRTSLNIYFGISYVLF